MPFACIFVPDFPAEAILRAEPELRSQALAVLEGKPALEKIFAVNEKARAAGIDPGMTRTQVEACTGLVLRSRSLAQETAAHAALLDCAQSFSPVVEDTACDTLALDLAGLEPLFGRTQKIACDLARRASDLGLEVNVAVASNPDAAVLAAHGFSGVTVIPPGEEAERLGNLPLEVLFAGFPGDQQQSKPQQKAAQFLETFDRWGLHNLRSLAALPEIALSERLGQEGLRLQQLARGAVGRTLVPIDLPLVFEETAELEYPLVLLEPLALLLEHMLEQICARLASRTLAAQELRLQLELEQGYLADEATERESTSNSAQASSFVRTLPFPVPMLDAKVFLKLLQLDLKAHPPGAPIRKVHLSVEPSRPRRPQGGLFQPVTPEPEKLELTLARISGIVGADKVGSVELLDTYRRESFHMQHFVGEPQRLKPVSKKDGLAAGLKPCSTQKQSLRLSSTQKQNSENENGAVTALRVFRPPLPATVTMQEGRPVRVTCPQRKEVQGEIVWRAGPWRSSGDWWQQDGWAQDDWDIAVQSESGTALYRLVRDLLSGKWFVEGSYD
ncbi:MAG TPA: DNA polymerase Y family protein [Terriglobales bacterium]|nr:DNA polymerase Y family protein [Terriglobales bacterium]